MVGSLSTTPFPPTDTHMIGAITDWHYYRLAHNADDVYLQWAELAVAAVIQINTSTAKYHTDGTNVCVAFNNNLCATRAC